jgi:hypothetical protein
LSFKPSQRPFSHLHAGVQTDFSVREIFPRLFLAFDGRTGPEVAIGGPGKAIVVPSTRASSRFLPFHP